MEYFRSRTIGLKASVTEYVPAKTGEYPSDIPQTFKIFKMALTHILVNCLFLYM